MEKANVPKTESVLAELELDLQELEVKNIYVRASSSTSYSGCFIE
jgi:hypothetical protein